MKVGKNKFVKLSYELRTASSNGEIIEKTEDLSPLEFVFGAGRMLEMFEDKLEGLTAGEKFDFSLEAEEAYGAKDEEAIVELPLEIFQADGVVQEDLLIVGNSIPMMDAQGNRLNGLVLEVTEEIVKMDFNHPLAGEKLHFTGNVLAVREATEDELIAASNVGGGGCGSGGCGSGGCGSGGCGTGEKEEAASCSSGSCGCGC